MTPTTTDDRARLHPAWTIFAFAVLAWLTARSAGVELPLRPQAADSAGTREPVDRGREFLAQELTTARPFSHIFNAGDTPRIVWRDLEQVRRLGADGRL